MGMARAPEFETGVATLPQPCAIGSFPTKLLPLE